MEKQKKIKSEWFFVPHFENNLPHEEEHSKEKLTILNSQILYHLP